MKSINADLLKSKLRGPSDLIDGVYLFKHPKIQDYVIQIIASTGMLWDHVSVTLQQKGNKQMRSVSRTPTWAEMCWVKDQFFESTESVIQIHPPHNEYVNNHRYCLHLWRYQPEEFPRPEMIMVGNDISVPMSLEGL